MNKYLEKIAKEYYQKTEVSDNRASSALGSALVGGITAHQLNSHIGNRIQQHYVRPMLTHKPQISNEVMKKVIDDVLPRTNTVLHLSEAGGGEAGHILSPILSKTGPAYFTPEHLHSAQKVVHRFGQFGNFSSKVLGKITGEKSEMPYDGSLGGKPTFNKGYITLGSATNTDTLAHELGHAVDFNTGRVGLKKAVSRLSRKISGVPAAALGGAALTNEHTRDYAWAVPIATAAPMLREEIAANKHAYDLVKKHGGDASKLKGMFRRNLTSYILPTLAASGGLAGINYLRRKGEEVNPDEWIKERE